MRSFMGEAARRGPGIAKIGLIKRDMTKLGAGFRPAVIWRNVPKALWRPDAPIPDGCTASQRVVKDRLPHCPTCGCQVTQEKKGATLPASASWLKSGRRTCAVCHSPLWQEARDRGSMPREGEKYPRKNPRYRLDVYLKRVYPDRVGLLVWDEVHEAQSSDTGNGESFGRMAGTARKVLAMTGTPFNGRSSSLFNLQYHLNPRVKAAYNWGGADRLSRKERGGGWPQVIDSSGKARGRAESRWVSVMGVREQVVEERPTFDSNTGAYTGTRTYQRPYEEAPGISPLLVAEMLDHTIYFSLGDLGKWLPRYEEVAHPVEMDADTLSEYDGTRAVLKEYLVQRRWEGDATFRGAYLQWAMGWANAPFRPYEVVHNIKHPLTGEKQAHTVRHIPSYGERRVYAKEQALIDLLRDELAADRPCVVYLRQTATRDIQPRIEALIREHVPGAQPFILKNTVQAERREQVIDNAVAQGVNVIICNPELTKTGLDLIFAPTIIYYELVFNLSTLMQAAARSYRLNQEHTHCKVIYLYYEGTMEQTAVHLMSRKQRAAKLLVGDVGLTGLEALTEGEGGLEEALLGAIAGDNALFDPRTLFTDAGESGQIDAEDAAFWNVETTAEALPILAEASEPEPAAPTLTLLPKLQENVRLSGAIRAYLERVHLVADPAHWLELQGELAAALAAGHDADGLTAWLRRERVVFPGCEAEVCAEVLRLAEVAPALRVVDRPCIEEEAAKITPFHAYATPEPAESGAVQLALF